MSSASLISVLAEFPLLLKKFIDLLYSLAACAVSVIRLLDASGISQKTAGFIKRRLRGQPSATDRLSSPSSRPCNARPHTATIPGTVYADYAGAPPYCIDAVRAASEDLLGQIWANPHSDPPWAPKESSIAVESLRHRVLAMCGASPQEYVCVLTSGATAALKLVAEAFPWRGNSAFVHLSDNHNSVLGVREVAAAAGAATGVLSVGGVSIMGVDSAAAAAGSSEGFEDSCQPEHLFAFPLESNFSGVRYSEELTTAVQQGRLQIDRSAALTWHGSGKLSSSSNSNSEPKRLPAGRWRVLVDAAKACGTRPPDLSRFPADFVAISLYKIFGHPTGLGALLVRRDALVLMHTHKRYFGGGTVAASLAEERFHALKADAAGLEDGSLPFLAVPAAVRAFESWDRAGGYPAAEAAAHAAAARLSGALASLRHPNGAPVCRVYGLWAHMDGYIMDAALQTVLGGQGPTVAFNILNSDGSWVGHRTVQRLASLEGIFLRAGVMCNPGACAEALQLLSGQMKGWIAAGVSLCSAEDDVIEGVPTGAVRASFGWGSTVADADAVADFVSRHFVAAEESVAATHGVPPLEVPTPSATVAIHSLALYPIKSAAEFAPRSWPIGSQGLLYDRVWSVVDSNGTVLTQRRCPALRRVHPVVDLDAGVLRVSAPGAVRALEIPLQPAKEEQAEGGAETVKGCGRGGGKCTSGVPVEDPAVSAWFSEVLGVPCCRLVRACSGSSSGDFSGERGGKSFANDAHLLMVSTESLREVQRWSGLEGEELGTFAARFRPNFVVEAATTGEEAESCMHPFDEEAWSGLAVPEGPELCAAGVCARCEMVNGHPTSIEGGGGPQPLLALARGRKRAGKHRLGFGALFNVLENKKGGEEQRSDARQERVTVGMRLAIL